MSGSNPEQALAQLLDVMRRLREPARGCPWDLEQTFETIVPYPLEEAYEVADAIARNDLSALRGEPRVERDRAEEHRPSGRQEGLSVSGVREREREQRVVGC